MPNNPTNERLVWAEEAEHLVSLRGPNEADTCREFVLPRLNSAGWTSGMIREQVYFTDGRIVSTDRRQPRRKGRRADYLLEIEGLRFAIVEAKRVYKKPGDGLQQAIDYARRLDLPLAYSSNGRGIVEHDFDTGRERDLAAFPSPDDVRARWRSWRGVRDGATELTLATPASRALRNADGTIKAPRYYQRVAIDRAVKAILDRRQRVLLTMATGSGKSFVAAQIVWKLWNGRWKTGRNPRVLYLADRNILVDQPIEREFRPIFGQAVDKIQGEPATSREIYFALYQSLADSGGDLGIFRSYSRDFFDLVIVDECHRGSARDDSTWRGILEHFAPAVQLGMTATPRSEDNLDTYRWFGEPVYEYSLAEGIDDGFLAPYRVRRVVLSPDAEGWSPAADELDRFGREIPPGLYGTGEFERVVSLLCRTEAAARHLTAFLQCTDPMAKTIVFCVDSDHAMQMRAALMRANEAMSRRYPDYVVRIVSAECDVGVEHLDDFADTERATPVIATTSKLLSTGVDLPTVRNIVLFKPIGSIVDFKQIIGRGTRLLPDADKLSFDIIDYVGATALFADPNFDGSPERFLLEEIGEGGETRRPIEVASPEPEASIDDVDSATDDHDPERRKLYVDTGSARVLTETERRLDPDSGRLTTVSFTDLAAAVMRRLYAHPRDLRARWRQREGRDEIAAALQERGVDLKELAEKAGQPDADALDLLIHLAWNGPLRSRRERAAAARAQAEEAFAGLRADARAVLEDLLEKYAEHGIDQLDDLAVLEVAPLTRHGSPVDIAARFGGADRLRAVVEEIKEFIYAA